MKIENFSYINKKELELVGKFLNSDKKYVLGRNKWADSILNQVAVDGIIDDFTSEEFYKGQKIFTSDTIDKNSIVVSAAMGGPQTAKTKLNGLGIQNIDYFSFYKYSKLELVPPPFMEDFKEDFINNESSYESIYKKLNDMKSKKVFEDVLNFKITFDLNFMKDYSNNITLQYFDDSFYSLTSNPVFLDGGGGP